MTEQPDSYSPQGGRQPERSGSEDRSDSRGTRSSESPGHPETGASSTASTRDPEDAPIHDIDEQTGLRSFASLERLRDRVEVAAREMKRLREENRALADRVKELESRPAVDPHGTFLSLDHDPELLKRKISGFIEAIDQYLEKESQ